MRYLVIWLFIFSGCKTADEYYQKALYQELHGYPKKAFYNVKRAIRKSPENYQYYLLKAQARAHGWITKKGSMDRVLKDFEKAFEYKPFALEIYKARWKYFEFEGDERGMLEDLQHVLNKDSTDVEAWLKIGQLNFYHSDTAKGYYCFSKASEFAGNKDSVLTFLADAEFNAKLFKKAKNRYLELWKRSDKVNFYRYHNLSTAYWNINNRDSACFYFKYVNKEHLFGQLYEINSYCK